ncbi:dorsal-related immunity factor Dif-like [Sipha flava]|nr:dorsal-related immunity factor Dif-like [Sipha flava]
MKNGKIIWECVADFNPSDVHKHTAICFKTPTYYLRNIENPVHVKIQLRRISDGKYGECYPFILTPDFSDFKNRKRIRLSRDSFNQCSRNPAYVSQQSIPNCTKVLTNVPYNIFESAVENIATIPENNRSSSGFFCPPLNPNVYDQFSSENKWTTPTQSTYQLTNTNSNMFCEQTKVKDQTPTDVNMDQQLNYPEILTTNQYNTFESESIKEILELPPNTSVYIKPSSTFSWTDSQIENKLLNENSNTMYGQADLYFQPNIGNSTYSANNSTVSPTLQSPEQSSQMNDIFDLLSKYPTEIDHSSNNTDISISGLSNIDDLLDDIENLSANLSSGLSI